MERNILAHATPPGGRGGQVPITTCCPDLAAHDASVAMRAAAVTACGEDMLVATVPVYTPAGAALLGGGSVGQPSSGLSPQSLSSEENAASGVSKPLLGVLLLRMPIAQIHAAAGRLWQLIFLCAVVGAALALAISMVVADRIAGPLRRMRKMAAKMAEGDFGVRLETTGRDEVGQLSASFNTMAERLKMSLASLQDESAKLRGVLSSMAEGVVAVSADGHILLANAQTFRVLNIPQKELVGQTLVESGLPEQLVRAFKVCLAERRMISEEIFTAPAAEPSVAAIDVVPMHLGDDEWGAVAVMKDVTEARRLEGMRRRFFSDISHELRTPLTNITGYASALEDGTASDEPGRARAISIILKESDRLKRFIEELLDLSRLESGQPGLEKEWCELQPIASEAAESLGNLAQQAKVKVHLDFPRDLSEVFADSHRLSQVFVNLISNAILYNRPGGEVVVSALADTREVRVIVKDTGAGISAEELPFVWGRFHRASPATQGAESNAGRSELQTKGSGLGLAIVRSIIQGHGGRVWAESVVGQGSTFGFALPLE
jgi:two-component system sensor histidine kinase ResE